MLDALPVDLQQPLGQGGEQPDAGVRRERPVLGDGLAERRARDVLGRQPVRRLVQPGADHRRGEPAAHALDRGDLAAEPGERLRAVEVRADDLERDVPAAGGQAQVHLAHAARADAGDHGVSADLGGVLGAQGFHVSGRPVVRACRA